MLAGWGERIFDPCVHTFSEHRRGCFGNEELNLIQQHQLILRWILHGEERLQSRQHCGGELNARKGLGNVEDVGKNEGQQ